MIIWKVIVMRLTTVTVALALVGAAAFYYHNIGLAACDAVVTIHEDSLAYAAAD